MGESHTLASTNPQSRRLYDYISRQDLMAVAAEASKKFRLYSRFALPHGSSYSLTCPHIDDGQRVEPCLCTVLLLLASIALQKSQQLDPHRLRVYLLRYTISANLRGWKKVVYTFPLLKTSANVYSTPWHMNTINTNQRLIISK